MENLNKIELRSEKVRNIIGKIPSWLARFGISIMTLIIVGLFVAAWYLPYPENLKVPIELLSSQKKHAYTIVYIPYFYIDQIKRGMPISLEFDGYNCKSSGYVKGYIHEINKEVIQKDQNYFSIKIIISTPNPKISLKDNMKGSAIILISNESILSHIFVKK